MSGKNNKKHHLNEQPSTMLNKKAADQNIKDNRHQHMQQKGLPASNIDPLPA